MIIDFYSQQGPMIIEQFVRWQLLSWILCFRLVCRPLKKQYPDLFALESAGAIIETNFQLSSALAYLINKFPFTFITH